MGEGMTTVAFGAAIGSMGAFYAATAMRGIIPGMLPSTLSSSLWLRRFCYLPH